MAYPDKELAFKSSATEDPNVRSPASYISVLLVKVSNAILITSCAGSTSSEQLFISQLKTSLAVPCSRAMNKEK